MKKLNKKGFTIVELVIVIAIIAILAAVMIPTFSGVTQKAKESAAFQEASHAKTSLLAIFDANLNANVTENEADFYIVSGEYTYKIVDGEMELTEESIVTASTAATAGNPYYATYSHEDLDEYDVTVYKYAGEQTATVVTPDP